MIDPRTHHHHHRHPHHCHHRHHYDKTLCFQVRQQEEKRIAPGKVKVQQIFGNPLTLIPSNSQSDQKYRFLCALPTEINDDSLLHFQTRTFYLGRNQELSPRRLEIENRRPLTPSQTKIRNRDTFKKKYS